MHVLALIVALNAASPEISRDAYGVPTIRCRTESDAYEAMGYAVAQDRLWQMEMSRRVARGRMSEILGPSSLASDTETVKMGYTDEELSAQFKARGADFQDHWNAYASGVNRYIEEATKAGALPAGYAKIGFAPEPWSPLDSASIAVMMARRFGGGGGYELMAYTALTYLKGQKCKDRVLDVIDDFLWQNDPASPTTVAPADEAQSTKMDFGSFTRTDTERQLEQLPKLNLFELLPAIKLAEMDDSRTLAMANSVLYKTGSYGAVVAPGRSRTNQPLLMGAPQMGYQNPSIVHEVAVDCPSMKVRGIEVPGVPGIVIGYTPSLAWTLTTSVADTTDVFTGKKVSKDAMSYGTGTWPLTSIPRLIKVKGQADKTVMIRRSPVGPVLLETASGAVMTERRSYTGRELEGFDAFGTIARLSNASEIQALAEKMTLGFNLFYATKSGDIGWDYCGMMPRRAKGLDPRFPTPASPENDWKGFDSIAKYVHLRNPKSGLIVNWNNKPVRWWPNLDTPAWGRLFRSQALLDSLPKGKIGPRDLEMGAWSIARKDVESQAAFLPFFAHALASAPLTGNEAIARDYLLGWDGWNTEGSQGARIYDACVNELRSKVFIPHTGDFVNPDVFDEVAQPSVLLNAIEGKTKYPYVAKNAGLSLALESFRSAITKLSKSSTNPVDWRYTPGQIRWTDVQPIPYSNRGTYIQIVDFAGAISARTINAPGAAETGTHATDQTALLRAWSYKPATTWP